jgi:hypothetical protein
MDDKRLERIERRMDDLDQRESAMEKAMERSRAAMNSFIPDETRRHMRAAWRENLLAMRSFIDYWAQKLGDDSASASGGRDSDNGGSNGGRENIPID